MKRVASLWKHSTVALVAACSLAALSPGRSAEVGSDRVLRVCQDPNNLPFSSRHEPGFENRIAELFARDLGWKLEYAWFPQRMGFVRNTLRSFDDASGRHKCDLIIGVPVGYEMASTTKAYYTSTYALVYARGRGLDGVDKPEDLLTLPPQKLRSLRIGVVAQTPPVDWLVQHGLYEQAVAYQRMSGDPEEYPGQIVERDLTAGTLDAAMVWGPIAGYFAKRVTEVRLQVIPFPPGPDIKFDFSIAMGVRYGEREWKQQVERLIDRNRPGIQAILAEFGVPLVDEDGRLVQPAAAPAGGRAGSAGNRKK